MNIIRKLKLADIIEPEYTIMELYILNYIKTYITDLDVYESHGNNYYFNKSIFVFEHIYHFNKNHIYINYNIWHTLYDFDLKFPEISFLFKYYIQKIYKLENCLCNYTSLTTISDQLNYIKETYNI